MKWISISFLLPTHKKKLIAGNNSHKHRKHAAPIKKENSKNINEKKRSIHTPHSKLHPAGIAYLFIRFILINLYMLFKVFIGIIAIVPAELSVRICRNMSKNPVLEMFSSVGAAGACLKISLVGVGFLLVAEGEGGFNVPRSKL